MTTMAAAATGQYEQAELGAWDTLQIRLDQIERRRRLLSVINS